jgi:hypothetical protein
MIEVFCAVFGVKCDDGGFGELGVVVRFPALLPIGSEIELPCPTDWDESCRCEIEAYHLDRRGRVWAHMKDFEACGSRESVIRDLRASGWISFREFEA